MSEAKLQAARAYIESGDFAAAKSILETMPDSQTAQRWLKRLVETLPAEPSGQARRLKQEYPDPFEEETPHQTASHLQSEGSTSMPVPRKPTSAHEIIVTTTDLPYPYRVIAPVYFQTSNKGVFSSSLSKLKQKYKDEIDTFKKQGKISKNQVDLGFIVFGEFSVGQTDFEAAFYVSVREIQNRAWLMKADAIVGMRQDIDLDTHGWQFFYLQMYGTAVRYL